MSVYTTDTHPILWFTLQKHGNLSPAALQAFADADVGNAFIHIPAIVLLETAILERHGKIKLNGGFLRWVETRHRCTRTRNYQFSGGLQL